MVFIYYNIFFLFYFSPEQLWILNPKRLLKRLDHSKYIKEIELQDKGGEQETALVSDGTSISSKDCWICYDSERQDAGPLIQPCQCRGDVSAVHHNCLRRWLVEVKYYFYFTFIFYITFYILLYTFYILFILLYIHYIYFRVL